MMASEEKSQYRKEWMLEVLKLMQGRIRCLNEVLRLTKEIGEGLDRNDRVSVEMLLRMRGEALEEFDSKTTDLHLFRESFPEETKNEIKNLLQGKLAGQKEDEAARIVEAAKGCEKTLEQTIALDKQMSKRVAGADSFYEQ